MTTPSEPRALFRLDAPEGPLWAVTSARISYQESVLQALPDLPGLPFSVGWLEAARCAAPGPAVGNYGELLAAGRLLAPCDLSPGRPAQILCATVNYGEHAREVGQGPSAVPSFFAKSAICLTDPTADITLPPIVDDPLADHEVELALIVGEDLPFGLRDPDRIGVAIAGFLLANDVSWRRFLVQDQGVFWRAKNGFRATPLGPAFLPTSSARALGLLGEELRPDLELSLTVERDGTRRQAQRARGTEMLASPLRLLRTILEVTELRRGDLLLTGTPPGVAMKATAVLRAADLLLGGRLGRLGLRRFERDPSFLRAGDRMLARADFLGEQQSRLVKA